MIAAIWLIAGGMWLYAAKNWYEAGRPTMVGLCIAVAMLNFFVSFIHV